MGYNNELKRGRYSFMKGKRMLINFLIAMALIVIVFVIVVQLQPAKFHIERSTTVAAPAAVVFEQVNDLRKWEAWSPWAKLDPNAKIQYNGPAAGTGAAFSWAGNNEVGTGTMTITDSRTNELVRFKLEFTAPMQAVNIAEFTFKPEGGQTLVTWSMSGTNGFMAKAFGLFVNCDKMVGGQFEKGLATLKSLAEGEVKK